MEYISKSNIAIINHLESLGCKQANNPDLLNQPTVWGIQGANIYIDFRLNLDNSWYIYCDRWDLICLGSKTYSSAPPLDVFTKWVSTFSCLSAKINKSPFAYYQVS